LAGGPRGFLGFWRGVMLPWPSEAMREFDMKELFRQAAYLEKTS